MQPHILALKSAVPDNVLEQGDVATRAEHLFRQRGDIGRLLTVFANTGIERRYSCVPIEWYSEPHGWTDRNALYIGNAVDLLEKVARALLADAKLAI